MTFKDHLACIGYGLEARVEALHHVLRGHKVKWRCEPDLWTGCTGHICCDECPYTSIEDGKHVGMTIWCRHWAFLGWIGARICGLIGHPILQYPRNSDGYITNEVYCYRCLWDGKLRAKWPSEDLTRETGNDSGPSTV